MVELFKIGNFGIYLFGVTIVLGMVAGSFVMLKEGKRKKLDSDKVLELSLYTLLASVIGARLYYIIAFNFVYYMENPLNILAIRNGGLSIQGGLIGGILFAIWYTKKKEISFWKISDVFAPGIIIGQAIGRIGCDVFGIPMKKIYPWGVMVNNQILHPVQIYEMILDLILFSYLWKKRDKIQYHGQLFIHYLIGFSIIRGSVEFFRSNPIVFGNFTVAHVTSVVMIGIAILIGMLIKNANKIAEEEKQNSAIKEGLRHYIAIGIIGVIGIWFYYFIHG